MDASYLARITRKAAHGVLGILVITLAATTALSLACLAESQAAYQPGLTFTGHVYVGQLPHTDQPAVGVRVELYGSLFPWSDEAQGTVLTTDITEADGLFELVLSPDACAYPYYHVVKTTPFGSASTGAQAGTYGSVVNPCAVTFVRPVTGVYTGIAFWHTMLAQPLETSPGDFQLAQQESSQSSQASSAQSSEQVTTSEDKLPHTLLIGDFVLFVERYDEEEKTDQSGLPTSQAVRPRLDRLEGLSGTAWLSFDCSAPSVAPGLTPLLPSRYVFDVVLIVTNPATQITLLEARLIQPDITPGQTLELQLPLKSQDVSGITAAKDWLLQGIEQFGVVVKGDIRVRFEDATIVEVPEQEGVGRIIEGVAFYPAGPLYPDIIRLSIDGFTALIDLLTLTPTGATANVVLELPPSIASEDACERVSIPLGEIAITPYCEFYAENPADPFGSWIVGDTGLIVSGTGYIADFSFSQSPLSKPASWKGVVLQNGTGSGSALVPTTSNTGYLAGEFSFFNATVEGFGFAGQLNLLGTLVFYPLQPLGYQVTLYGANLEVSESRIVSGQLGPGSVELPVRAVCKDGHPGDPLSATFSLLTVQADLDVGGEVTFGFGTPARMAWGELTHSGDEVVAWVLEVRKGYIYLPAIPGSTFSPDTGVGFLNFFLPSYSIDSALAALESQRVAGITIGSVGMENLEIHSPDRPGGTTNPLKMANVNGWLRIGSRGVDGDLQITEWNMHADLGNTARHGYVGGEPFNTTLILPSKDETPMLLQYATSAVYDSEINGEVDIPEPCNIQELKFADMEVTSTAHLAGGDIELPVGGVTLEYWDVGFVPTGDPMQAGVVSVRTGRLIFTAAGISEYVHFDKAFGLTWCEIFADGNLGELFLDYNSYGQRFDKLPFSAHQLSLSECIPGMSGLDAGAYLAVCGDVHFNFFGSAYVNVKDARYPDSADPYHNRYVSVPNVGDAACDPTDLHLTGEVEDALGRQLASVDFPDATMDYNEESQQGFIGTGSTQLSFLHSDGLDAIIDIHPDPITGEPVIDICLRSSTVHDVDFGLFARLTSMGEITGCIRIEGPLLKRIAIGGYMEHSASTGFGILAPKAAYIIEVNISVTPNSATFYAGGDLLLAVAGSAVDVSGSVFLTVDYTRASAEGQVIGRIDCNSVVVGLEGEGQLTWYVDPQEQYVQGKVSIELCSWIGGVGLEGGIFVGHNVEREKVWVLSSASEHFGIDRSIPATAKLTGLYGYGQLSAGIQLYVFGGGFKVYMGMGAFLPTPEAPIFTIAGSGGIYVHGEILGGLVSASAWADLDLYGPPFYFEGSFGLKGCVLWVICASIDVTAGFDSDGLYIY
ncbi:hypothetical protein ACFLSW_05155 [Candidatus Bipolaricaulota bacterium]